MSGMDRQEEGKGKKGGGMRTGGKKGGGKRGQEKKGKGIGFATTFTPKEKRPTGMAVSFTTKKVGRKAKPKPKSTLPLPMEVVEITSAAPVRKAGAPGTTPLSTSSFPTSITSSFPTPGPRKRKLDAEKGGATRGGAKVNGTAPPPAPPAMIRRNTSKLRKPKRKKKKPLDPNQASISSFFMPT